jgi:Fe2+ transport system protein B
MQTAAIAYRNVELEAREQDDLWAVRLGNREARARYLDLALAELLGDSRDAHRAAARLLAELADVVDQEEVADSQSPLSGERRRVPSPRVWARPVLLGVRVFVFALIASTAFMLTTWLSALR